MRWFSWLFLLFILMAGALYGLLYTERGHEKIASYLSHAISQKTGYPVDIAIKEMALNPSHLDIVLIINHEINAKIEGFLALSGVYEIGYHITGEEISYQGKKLKDKIDLVGTLNGDWDDFILKAKGEALEGKVELSLHHLRKENRDIILHLENISNEKALIIFNQKPLLAGTFSLDADIPLFSMLEKEGEMKLDMHKSGLYLRRIYEAYGIIFPDDFMLSLQANVRLENGKEHFDAKLDTTQGGVTLTKGSYIEALKMLRSDYEIETDALEKWAFLTHKKLRGPLRTDGVFKYQNGFQCEGMTDSLGGESIYRFQGHLFSAKLKDVALEKLLYRLSYPAFISGTLEGSVHYDTTDKITTIDVSSDMMSFQSNTAIKKIFAASGVDLSKERFTKTTFSSYIKEGIVSYDFHAKSPNGYLSLLNSKMDAAKNTISSQFDLKMQKQEFSGEIYGSLKNPQVKLDVGKYLEFKAKKEIDEFFGTGTTEKVKKKIKNVDVDDVKTLIKGLF